MYNTRALIIALLLVALAVIVALWREDRRAASLGDGPRRAGGRVERCLACHDSSREDPGGVHSAEALGCSSCHLGNPLALERERAHAGMEPEPGALATVDRTCGRRGCHVREVARVRTSLMARGSGIIAVDRWVFGERPTPDGTRTMEQLLAQKRLTPAESHLRKLCAGCHLHSPKDNRDDAVQGIGSGCSACHYSSRPAPSTGSTRAPVQHGPVDARVPDSRCLGCHSRSGRISLSYKGLAEVQPGQEKDCRRPARLHDGRPACEVTADVHQQKGLSCVDCHLHTDLMGDGTARPHKEDQVEITCEACHPRQGHAPEIRWARVQDPISRALLRLRKQQRDPLETARVGRRKTPLWNVRREPAGKGSRGAATWVLVQKSSGKRHPLRPTPADANHTLVGHERLSCQACHSTWAPTCTTCHTSYDNGGQQWDFGKAARTPGAWKERAGGQSWGPPTLARTAKGRVVPAVPGMILTVQGVGKGAVRRRLFAALDPHTTRKEARSCASCHRSPVALGLGAGELELTAGGARFTPKNRGPAGAPARDAWTTLDAVRPGQGTRTGLRSFNAEELRRVLAVGRCTPCHKKAADSIYGDFKKSLAASTGPGSRCALARAR